MAGQSRRAAGPAAGRGHSRSGCPEGSEPSRAWRAPGGLPPLPPGGGNDPFRPGGSSAAPDGTPGFPQPGGLPPGGGFNPLGPGGPPGFTPNAVGPSPMNPMAPMPGGPVGPRAGAGRRTRIWKSSGRSSTGWSGSRSGWRRWRRSPRGDRRGRAVTGNEEPDLLQPALPPPPRSRPELAGFAGRSVAVRTREGRGPDRAVRGLTTRSRTDLRL